MDVYFQAMLDEEGLEFNDAFTEEVKQYFEEQKKVKQPKRVARQLTSGIIHPCTRTYKPHLHKSSNSGSTQIYLQCEHPQLTWICNPD